MKVLRTGTKRRTGLSIVPALSCLVVLVVMTSVLVKQVGLHRGVTVGEERRLQAECLADAALARAAARLAADWAYKGETWEIAAGAIPPSGNKARATITVVPVKDRPDARRVRVEAVYPPGDDRGVRQTKTLIVNLGPG